jgi:cell cycle sensor histidine kinase DivJ
MSAGACMCCELRILGLLRSIYQSGQRVLRELAERWIESNSGTSRDHDPVRVILAERLIALGAGATFVVAPVCIILAGTALPGTYGAATAIALIFIAVPFLALGWLAIAKTPFRVALVTVAVWAALSGAVVPVSPALAFACGAVLYFCGFGRDTAERLSALLTPKEGKAVPVGAGQNALTESINLGIGQDGTIRAYSGTGSVVFASGRLFIDYIHISDRIAVLSALNEARTKSVPAINLTARLDLGHRGEPQRFETVSLAISASDKGNSVCIRRMPAGQEMPKAVIDSDSLDRQRFLATVSHELRTPLNSIIGFSDILRRELFGAVANDRQREYVDLIHSSGNHLLSIVNTILDVSRLEAGTYPINREAFDLNGTVSECVSMLRPQAEKKAISVTSDFAPEIAEADGDRRALRQVVINLLSNAIKFTGEGGTVKIMTGLSASGYQIRIADDGIGMSESELAQIGRPFVQVDNLYTRTCEGTGLGLTVVKGLIALHGGSLDVESLPGAGTAVTVSIPDRGIRQIRDFIINTERKDDGFDRQGAGQGGKERKENANAARLAG